MSERNRLDELGGFKYDKDCLGAVIAKHRISVNRLGRPISPGEISGVLQQLREEYGEDVDKKLSGNVEE